MSLLCILFISSISIVNAQCPDFTIPPTICAGGNCAGGTLIPLGQDTSGIAGYIWYVTAPDGDVDTVQTKDLVYSFGNPGSYQISLSVIRGTDTLVCSTKAAIVQQGVSDFTIGPDNNMGPQEEEICKGTSITLQAVFQQGGSAPAGATYLWSTGATTPTITVDTVGCYSVTITDPNTGCSKTNKVNLKVYKPSEQDQQEKKEISRWYFGNGSGVIFYNTSGPEATTGSANTPEGTSAISDASGKFLFYTDGRNVYDKTGAPMKDVNGNNVTVAANNGLHGGENSTQAVLIVAQPGCNDCEPVYYVFTTTDISSTGSVLEYSIVDMRLNGGLGQVTRKNVILYSSSTERVVSVKSTATTGDATTWIVTHDFNTNTFRVYPLTASGLGSSKTYNVGNVHGASTENGEGYLKAYEDKVVVVIPGANGEENIVQVFPFDSETGEVKSPPITINLGTAPPKAYGVEIVEDSTLYVSLAGSGADSSRILGFDLRSGVDSLIQKTKRSIFATTSYTIGALQLDPNGQNLYVAQQGQTSLGQITNYTTLASAGYNANAVTLTATSELGLPNTGPPQNDAYGQSFTFSSAPCTLEGKPVTITFKASPDRAGGDPTKSSYAWTFTGTTVSNVPFSLIVPDGGLGVNDSIAVTFPGPGTYKAALTITNDCQSEVIDPQTVIIPLQPPLTNMRDTSVCAGTVVRLDPYRNIPSPSGTVSYTWITPSKDVIPGGGTLDVTLPGVYTVIVSTGKCSVTDSMRVSYSSIDVNLGNDTLLCSQSTLVLNAGNPGAKYEWYQLGDPQIKSTTQTYSVTPTANVSYLVKVTDVKTGCTDSDTISIGVRKNPNVTITTKPSSSCTAGDGAAELTTTDPDKGTYIYTWLDSDRSPLFPSGIGQITGIENRAPGTYYLVIMGPTICLTTIPFSIGDNSADAPQFTSNSPVQLTCDQTTGTLELTPSTSNITSYQLATTDGSVVSSGSSLTSKLTIAGLTPGSYLLTGNYGGSGCTFSFTYEVKAAPGKPQVQGVGTVTDCQTAQLSATGVLGDVSSFQWNRLDGTAITTSADGTATVTQSGTYILSATGSTSCVAKDTVVITLGSPGTASIANYTPVCEGGSVVLTANTSPAFDSYTWVRPDLTIVSGTQITATIPGEYKLIARNTATNCADSVSTTPFVKPPDAPNPTQPGPVCAGNPIPDVGLSGLQVRWYADAAKTQFLSSSPTFLTTLDTDTPGTTTYYVSQLSSGGCEGPAIAVTVTIIEGPTVNLGNDTTVCAGNPVVLNATVSGIGVTYKWSTGATTPTITVSSAGTYSVAVTSGSCTISDTIKITYLTAPVVNVVQRQVALCLEEGANNVTLDAGPGTNYTYVWTLAGSATVLGTEQKLTVTQLGTYVVTVNNGSICPGRDTVRVVNICRPILELPQAFSPNSDGHNDVLEVFSKHVGSFKIMIFNRWGEVVYAFETTNLYEAATGDAFPLWDGKYRGQDAPTGTYSWRAVYTSRYYPEGTPVERRGGILLIR
ncbi:gliding motility-associated C-terminal domain-containing protein [Cytophagaceae bacterium YF14B1]|uniref:Gliding motility-associated C-terminal domain-containing protein n=1 Tax=Xanthocytophaga flava TaxID=3048013 RepID=A0AAE3UAR5_9BACT|nr:gliding motility-associated C-terminal domain-containing protein [Xanthocytophaga flavus]MDJ1483019.1 gliding motility-associated C-terminal domain-containing protein [Xanthocytophaga flavus]